MSTKQNFDMLLAYLDGGIKMCSGTIALGLPPEGLNKHEKEVVVKFVAKRGFKVTSLTKTSITSEKI